MFLKQMLKNADLKQKILLAILIISALLLPSHFTFATELTYPEVFGNKPGSGLLQFIKYLYNFIIISGGLIALGVISIAGMKWLTSAGNPAKLTEAKSHLWMGLFGVAIIFSANLILSTINPDLTWLKIQKAPIKTFNTSPAIIASKESAKTILARMIPLQQLAQESEIEGEYLPDGVAESDAEYSDISEEKVKDYEESAKELIALSEPKQIATQKQNLTFSSKNLLANLSFEKIKGIFTKKETLAQIDPGQNFGQQVQTKLEDLKELTTPLVGTTNVFSPDNRYNFCLYEGEGNPPALCPIGWCRIDGMIQLKALIDELENINRFYGTDVQNRIEDAQNDLRNIFPEEDLNLFSLEDLDKSLEMFNESYSNEAKSLVERIYTQAQNIKITNCSPSSLTQTGTNSLNNIKNKARDFRNGYNQRSKLWDSFEMSMSLKGELDKMREISKEELKLEGSDYKYEGAAAATRLNRINNTNAKLNLKASQIQKVSAIMAASAGLITGLTPTCNCALAGVACVTPPDPCWPVRPVLIGAQIVLGAATATLPPTGAQLQKEIGKATQERESFENSIERLTNGLQKAESLMKSCVGTTSEGYQRSLLSLYNFINYREQIEKLGYQIEITNPWPEIETSNNPFTFFCVEGPAYPGITEASYPHYASPYGNRKVMCEKETEVGELFEKVYFLANQEKQIKQNMDASIENAQKIISVISNRNTGGAGSKTTSATGQTIADKAKEEATGAKIIKNLPGDRAKELLKKSTRKLLTKNLQNWNRKILDKLSNIEILNVTRDAINGMNGRDLKTFSFEYFNSLKDEKKKEVSHAIFESIEGDKIQEYIDNFFSVVGDNSAREFFSQTLDNMSQEGKERLFDTVFSKIPRKDALELYNILVSGISKEEGQALLEDMAETKARQEIFKILSEEFGQSINSEEDIKDAIYNKITSSEKVREILSEVGLKLDQVNQLKDVILDIDNVEELTEYILDNFVDDKNTKKFAQIIFDGIPEEEVKNFILYDIIEFDPSFLERQIDKMPLPGEADKSIKDLVLNDLLESAGGDNLKKILNKANYALTADPKTVLNDLVLKHLPNDQLARVEKIAKEIKEKIKPANDFIGELMEVMPVGQDIVKAKDMLDKATTYLNYAENARAEVKNLATKHIGEWAQEALNSRDFQEILETREQINKNKNDLLDKLPEKSVKDLAKQFIRQEAVPRIDEFIGDMVRELPLDKYRRITQKALKNANEDFQREKAGLDAELRKVPDTPEGRAWLNAQWDEIWTEIQGEVRSGVKSNEDFKDLKESILDEVPNVQIHDVMKDMTDYMDWLQSDINNWSEQDEDFNQLLENIDWIIDKMPRDINETIDSLLTKIDNNVFGKINEEIFGEDSNGSWAEAQGLVDQLANYMPENVLERYMDDILVYADQAIDKAFDELGLTDLINEFGASPILQELFAGQSGLKQNGIEMIKMPPLFNISQCTRSWVGGGLFGGGFSLCTPPAPPWIYTPKVNILMAGITRNVFDITTANTEVSRAVTTIRSLIDGPGVNVNNPPNNLPSAKPWQSLSLRGVSSESVWSNTDLAGKNFGQVFPRPNTSIPMQSQQQWYKCEDAMRYGWINKCDNTFNFVACQPAR